MNLRRRVWALIAVLSLAWSVSAQQNYQHVAEAPAGEVAFEYVGMVLQRGGNFETFGYFTYIHGMPDELLYFDPERRDERQARFTFHSLSKMTNRSIVRQVFAVNAEGDMAVYARSQPVNSATIEQGSHFKIGSQVASLQFRGQSVVVVTAPNMGVNSATLEVRQGEQRWRGFRYASQDYAFGRPGMRYRFQHIGRGDRTQVEPPVASMAIAGRAIAVGK